MAYKIIFTPLALIDTDETAGWYDNQMPGLGRRFLLDLEVIMKIINSNPFTFSFLNSDIRQASLKKFPYVVLYFIDRFDIHILAIVNTKRSKRYIKRRIKKRH